MAIAGLIVSIVGLVSAFGGFAFAPLAIAGLPISIVGLVLSVLGGKKTPGGIATAGLVIGILATIFTAITFFSCGLCVLCAATVL